MGAVHVLWNIRQAIFQLHFGNNSNQSDMGAWHLLSALGIPRKQPTLKKDYSLLITHVKQIHKATILYVVL